MTSPSLRRSIGLALVSVGVEVVEGWEAHPESLDGTVTLVGVAVGVLGPGVAEPIKFEKMRQKTYKRYQTWAQ